MWCAPPVDFWTRILTVVLPSADSINSSAELCTLQGSYRWGTEALLNAHQLVPKQGADNQAHEKARLTLPPLL